MPPSQLKMLKAALKDKGVIGPTQSKKQKRKISGDKKRVDKRAVLASLNEQFHPFDFKHNARGPKFPVTTNRPIGNGINGRPIQARSAGEEKRRRTLLVEAQRRNRVGGIVDRRFGENDTSMTPEQKMMERFAREKERGHNKHAMFNLEDDEPEDLTHMGRPIEFGEGNLVDDFNEKDLEQDGSEEEDDRKRLKRKWREEQEGEDEDGRVEEVVERRKTKQEVMEEVIAKSKLYKYERQAAKEDDDDLRMKLDDDWRDIKTMLYAGKPQSKGDRPPTLALAGMEKSQFDRDLDLRVKQLAQESRAQPTERTKTAEELAEEEAARLQELEEKRLKRMMGQDDEDDESEADGKDAVNEAEEDEDFGLGNGIRVRPTATELGLDDEDDFFIEDDLVASDVEDESDSEGGDSADDGQGAETEAQDDEDDDFVRDLLNDSEKLNPVFTSGLENGAADGDDLPFTFPCPKSLDEFLAITKGVTADKIPIVVRRIRVLYQPKLAASNKEKMEQLGRVLVEYLAHSSSGANILPPSVAEALIRHIHSIAKSHPVEIAKRFLLQIKEMEGERAFALNVGDLVILTAIGTIFPTSDSYHRITTPAMLSIGRFLGLKVPRTLADYATGLYLAALMLSYQGLSKRYVPELMNFTLNTLCTLAPTPIGGDAGNFPLHEPPPSARIHQAAGTKPRQLRLHDCLERPDRSPDDSDSLKAALLDSALRVLDAAADMWHAHPAFAETFLPAQRVLSHLSQPAHRPHLPTSSSSSLLPTVAAKLTRLLSLARLGRRPLELHHHRPVAIRTFAPRFEDGYAPGHHYDPDRERAESARLRKEHRRERKGAMRELRRDAEFLGREKLRARKERDQAYDKKFKRLVAEIQGEEGREKNQYGREKERRRRERKKMAAR